MTRNIDEETRDNILTIACMADNARKDFAGSKQWTVNDGSSSSCETIRVPVAMLNRIRDLAEANNIRVPD